MTAPTSPTNDRRDRRGGFTLIELMMALAIMALIAGLALPRVYPGAGATTGRATAYAIAAILREDRNAALAGGSAVSTRFDEGERRVSSGGRGGGVTIPIDMEASADGLDGGTIRFSPDGRSTGGAIVLTRGRTSYSVRVDPLTGGVQILTGAL